MSTASVPRSYRVRSSLLSRLRSSAWGLLALAAISACGSELTPSLVEMSGRTVEIVEAGAGDITVVFESGLGDDWAPWDKVASEVADEAQVFAYSRPGYGDSDPSPDPRTPTQIVEDLRTLLLARGFEPPYVLVGHSFGGTYMELFAKAYPDEVIGLVLVDPRHRDFTSACAQAGLEGCSIPASALRSLPPVQVAELDGFETASEAVLAAGEFGSYPVRVLTATRHQFAPEVEDLWESMLGSLADESADGEQIIFRRASHYLQLKRTQEVAGVILSLVSDLEEP